ncbi:MAG: glycosyltransferase [Alcaligenaceae bacterium]|nr:MAG: glycosyltransferase [Alcaligenaceae bacterium]
MRVAVVHSFYSSSQPSGENTVVLAQVDALAGAGHDVKLISQHTDDSSSRRAYKLRAALSAANIGGPSPQDALEAFRPDIIHGHNLFPNWGTNWLGRWGRKTVFTLHNYRTVCASGILWRDGHECTECISHSSARSLRHRCYRNSTPATIPLAWSTRSQGENSPTLNKARSLIVLNAKALEFYRNLRPEADLNLIPNFAEPVQAVNTLHRNEWIYVGRLVPEKGIGWLLDNWPLNHRLTIVGAGPLEEHVAQAAKNQPERFRFLGRQNPNETRQAIARAHGLILPSLWAEGIPTVALEALQSGTPILVSDRCASAAELTEGGAGHVFTLDRLGKSLAESLTAVEMDEKIRIRAAQAYQRRYSEDVWIKRIEELYDRIAAHS